MELAAVIVMWLLIALLAAILFGCAARLGSRKKDAPEDEPVSMDQEVL